VLFEAGAIIAFLSFAFWIWAVVDCITIDATLCRNLPKVVWLVIVILLFDLGAVLWLLLGRPARPGRRPPTDVGEAPRRVVAPGNTTRSVGSMTDRRSAELDRQLELWEAGQRGRGHPSLGPPDPELDAKDTDLDGT